MRNTSKSYAKVYTAMPDEGMELVMVPWQTPSAQDMSFDDGMVPPYEMDMKIDDPPLVQHSSPAKDNCLKYCA